MKSFTAESGALSGFLSYRKYWIIGLWIHFNLVGICPIFLYHDTWMQYED